MVRSNAARVGSAARVGGLRAAGAALLLTLGAPGCVQSGAGGGSGGLLVATAPQPEGPGDRVCAWYGDAAAGVLYFGESAFWAAARAHGGDPLAEARGPSRLRRIGRCDLASEHLLEPLDAGSPATTGVWDVLAHPNGRVYFTTWFDSMGWIEPSGAAHRLPGLGRGLNEIALGPRGALLVSRYGDPDDPHAEGSVLLVSPEGERLAEYPLAAPPGWRAAPKTVGYDSARDEIWVTTDVFGPPGSAMRHDAYVLDGVGRERRRIESPEVQFVAFRPEGGGLLAELEGARLWLRVRQRSGPDRVLLADAAFPGGHDFVQDIRFAADGRAVVTRWSGVVHVVPPDGSLETLRLPALEEGGLYYSCALADGRVCATHCGGIEVVCAPLPSAPR
jgi:hypothetical protein